MAWRMPDTKSAGRNKDLVAFPIKYDGPDSYAKSFSGSGYGLVFDDDGETGYLYVTSEDFSEVFDTLHLYNWDTDAAPNPGETAYFIWSEAASKAGMFFRGEYLAIVDFANARACCRTGYPDVPDGAWCTSPHTWDPEMEEDMLFDQLEEENGGNGSGTA